MKATKSDFLTPAQAIGQWCANSCIWRGAERCTATNCPLWWYRDGRDIDTSADPDADPEREALCIMEKECINVEGLGND